MYRHLRYGMLLAMVLSLSNGPFRGTALGQLHEQRTGSKVRNYKTAGSPNGQYLLSADPTDPGLEFPGGGRIDGSTEFVYVLRDSKTQKEFWKLKTQRFLQERAVPEHLCSGPPRDLFVNNDGASVIWMRTGDLVSIDRKGRVTGRIQFLTQGISKQNREKFVRKSFLGTVIGTGCEPYHAYFASHQGNSYFIVRTWWNDRVVFDIQHGKLVRESKELNARLSSVESNDVMKILKDSTQPKAKESTEQWRSVHLAAVHLAGRLKLKDSIPLLRKLESDLLRVEHQRKRKADSSWRRQLLQLSLRRLGETPRQVPRGERSVPRTTQSVSLLKRNMTADEVLRTLGATDYQYDNRRLFVTATAETWEYDIDADKPYTLIVRFEPRVVSLKRISPAKWQETNQRDRMIFLSY